MGLFNSRPGDGVYGNGLTDILLSLAAPKVMGLLHERDGAQAKQKAAQQQQEVLQQAAGLLRGPDGKPLGAREFADRIAQMGILGSLRPEDSSNLLNFAKVQDPETKYEEGVPYDARSANGPKFIPKRQDGGEPLYDSRGNIVGIRTMDGALEHTGNMERAKSDAQNASRAEYAYEQAKGAEQARGEYAGPTEAAVQGARAPYGTTTIPGSDGRPEIYRNDNLPGGPAPAPRSANTGRAPTEADLKRIFPQGYTVNSGTRSPADQDRLRRQGLNPARNSNHLKGAALDIAVPGMTPAQVVAELRKNGLAAGDTYAGKGHAHVYTGGAVDPAAARAELQRRGVIK